MSTLTNVVMTEFRARGSQVTAVMGQMAAGSRQWSSGLNENIRQSDRLNQQWRAIGTTIRYAIAGQAVFGLTRMVGQLKEVQVQLGLMQAIGSRAGSTTLGGTPFSTREITQLGSALQNAAADSITSFTDMNNAAINFLSTVQNVDRADIPGILTQVARGATLTQTPIEDLTQLVTTMNIAFGRSNTPSAINENVRQWFALIQQAPGGIKAAPELVKAIPNVSTVFQQGLTPNLSAEQQQAQMMSLILGSLRFGATPATAMRGLAYLLQSLETPASKAAGTALTGIGITPTTVREKGIYETLIDFLRKISGNMTKAQLTTIQQIPEDQLTEGMNLPGVAPNQMKFLRTSLGRIHAIRAAIVLAGQLNQRGDVASLEQQLKLMQGAQEDTLEGTANFSRAWQDYRGRAKLQDMSNQVNIMLLQVSQSFEGILNWFATNVVDPFAKFTREHKDATKAATLAGAGALALYGGASFFRGGRATRAIAGAQTVRSLTGTEADGSAANPFFVIVTNQLFNPYGIGGKGREPLPVPPGGGKVPPGEVEKAGRLGRLGRRLPMAARIGSLALGWEAAVMVAGAFEAHNINQKVLPDWLKQYSGTKGYGNLGEDMSRWLGLKEFMQDMHRLKTNMEWIPGVSRTVAEHTPGISQAITVGRTAKRLFGVGEHAIGSFVGGHTRSAGGPGAGGQLDRVAMNDLQRAQAIWGKNVIGVSDPRIEYGPGGPNDSTLNLNIKIKHPDGSVEQKKVHLRYKQWQNGKHPTQGGKAAKTRR